MSVPLPKGPALRGLIYETSKASGFQLCRQTGLDSSPLCGLGRYLETFHPEHVFREPKAAEHPCFSRGEQTFLEGSSGSGWAPGVVMTGIGGQHGQATLRADGTKSALRETLRMEPLVRVLQGPKERGDSNTQLFLPLNREIEPPPSCDACLEDCGSGKFFLTCQKKKLSWVEGICPKVCHWPLTKGCLGLGQGWAVLELEEVGLC